MNLLQNATSKKIFAQKLINWYARHKRDLPWRHTTDPYLIWLSEVILQQTRVKQGMPYYTAFAGKYPTVSDLALADERDVLRLWQGLGYYARARNMHATAKIVHLQYGGIFPDTYAGLLTLKGIGPYTAAAIASFAFRERVAVLDGNVFRVLARLYGINTDIASNEAKKIFSGLANELISEEQPDIYNQAIMEFGAMLCTPAKPQCMFCPFQNECVANLTGRQEELPVKSKKAKGKERFFHYLIFTSGREIAMKERTGKDIWSGLYDFYLLEQDRFMDTDELLQQVNLWPLAPDMTVEKVSDVHIHVLTHQRVQAKFWHISLPPASSCDVATELGLTFFNPAHTEDLPKPVLINKYLNEYIF
jgi:A/G-specific adenine glycosylase